MIELTVLDTSPDALPLDDAAALLAVAADPVRLGIIRRLASLGTRCVCDLQPEVPIAQNVFSYHLKVLREAGLVTTAKRGRWVDYTLAEDALDRLHSALPANRNSATGACQCR